MVDSTRYLIIYRDFLVHMSQSAGLDVHHVSFFMQTFGPHRKVVLVTKMIINQEHFVLHSPMNWAVLEKEISLSLLKVGRVKPTKDCQFLADCGGKKLCTFAQTNKPAAPTDTTEKIGVVQPSSRAQRNTIIDVLRRWTHVLKIQKFVSLDLSRESQDFRAAHPTGNSKIYYPPWN